MQTEIAAWESLMPTQIEGKLAAIEQLLAIDHPVTDEAYRFLAWAIHRAFHVGSTMTTEHQLLVMDAFRILMRHRSTTLTQRLQNDRHYMTTFAASGVPASDNEDVIVTLDQMLDCVREVLALEPAGALAHCAGHGAPSSDARHSRMPRGP
jgi:hypothetical protein